MMSFIYNAHGLDASKGSRRPLVGCDLAYVILMKKKIGHLWQIKVAAWFGNYSSIVCSFF